LRDALSKLVEDRTLRQAMGARSRELANRFTPEAWAEAIVGAVSRLAR
jgi:hypothetical protein